MFWNLLFWVLLSKKFPNCPCVFVDFAIFKMNLGFCFRRIKMVLEFSFFLVKLLNYNGIMFCCSFEIDSTAVSMILRHSLFSLNDTMFLKSVCLSSNNLPLSTQISPVDTKDCNTSLSSTEMLMR